MKNIKIIVEDKELELSEETSKMVMSELKKDKKEFPQVGDKIYFIDEASDNFTCNTKYTYSKSGSFIKNLINTGNCYQTKEKLKKQVEKLKAIVKVKNYIKDNFGYDPEDWADWGDCNIDKYLIYYDYVESEIDFEFTSNLKPNSFIGYIKTDDECKILIKNCKKELELICK